MSLVDDQFWIDQITAAQAALLALQSAILSVQSGAQSYSLDTGQTRQVVTKATLSELRLREDQLLDRIATLEARVGGGGHHVIPNS